jgi:GDP-L-fucose synthase
MKIYVAGHRGLVGSALTRRIKSHTPHTLVSKSRSELNLFDSHAVSAFIGLEKPDAIIIAAAKVGGIGANAAYPVEFLAENLRIELNILEAAHEHGIERVVFLGSSCIYPKLAHQPITEDSLLTGPLETTNEPYAIAKIAGIRLTQAFSSQYGRDWISLLPTNIYGPGDRFDPELSHVLPALIQKFHHAKEQGLREVELWGTGEPRREFLYSEDLADACIFLLENYHSPEPINVGVGKDISISELAQKIKQVVGFDGEIIWDASKPDGTPRKVLDVSKLKNLGWVATTSLDDGLRLTYDNYLSTV